MGVTSDAYMIPTSPDDSARRFFFRKNSSQPPWIFVYHAEKLLEEGYTSGTIDDIGDNMGWNIPAEVLKAVECGSSLYIKTVVSSAKSAKHTGLFRVFMEANATFKASCWRSDCNHHNKER